MSFVTLQSTEHFPSVDRPGFTWRRIGIVVVLAVAGLAGGCAPASQSVDVLLARGKLFSEQGKHPEAIEALTLAIQRSPARQDLYFERGRAQERAADFEAAIDDYTEAIRLKPNHFDSLNNRAAVSNRLGRFKEAVTDLTKAIELRPRDAVLLCYRGRALRELGQNEAAMSDFRRAIEVDAVSPRPWLLLGNLHLDAERAGEAEACFTRAIKLAPQSAEAWRDRAAARVALGDTGGSRYDMGRAIEIDPEIEPLEGNTAS